MSTLRANAISTLDGSVTVQVSDLPAFIEGSLGYLQVIPVLDDLRSEETSEGRIVYVRGYNSAGDGGEGFWVFKLGDYANEVALDGENGVWLPANGVSTSNGVWERIVQDKKIRLEWFGGMPDSESDITEQLQSCIDVAQYLDAWVILPANNRFQVTGGVTMYHGQDPEGDGTKYNVYIDGQNCWLMPGPGIICLDIFALGKNNGTEVADLQIHNIVFQSYYADSNTMSLRIGGQGAQTERTRLECFNWGLVSNLHFREWNLDGGGRTLIRAVRKVTFRDCIWQGTGVTCHSDAQGQFTGDLAFDNCEFNGNETWRPYESLASAGGSGTGFGGDPYGAAAVGGIHFTNCVTYGSGTLFKASNGANVADTWFTSCAWDQSGMDGVPVTYETDADSRVYFHNLLNCYMVGFTNKAVFMNNPAGGQLFSMQIAGNYFGSFDVSQAPANEKALIHGIGVQAMQINGGFWEKITGGVDTGYVLLDNCSEWRVSDVQSMGVGAAEVQYGIRYNAATCSNFMIVNNSLRTSSDVIDASFNSGSPAKVVVNNLAI